MKQKVVISGNLERDLVNAISECEHDRIFVLTDETTQQLCWPKIKNFKALKNSTPIIIKATDTHKNLDTLSQVWQALSNGGATRHSLMINLGGGMVTDLAMVDASVGGKTGINFGGLKNEIGVFSDSRFVIINTQFLDTLDHDNICSGYAEMLKHGLISDERTWAELVTFDLDTPDLSQLQRMVAESIKVKERIVEADPHEHGIRKALNLGHTMGHAFESFAMRRGTPILHGYAVAYGLISELYMSARKTAFPTDRMHQTVRFIRENYGTFNITCDDYPTLIELMRHDKKNTSGIINFTLLGNVGDIRINQTANEEEIKEALDFFREG